MEGCRVEVWVFECLSVLVFEKIVWLEVGRAIMEVLKHSANI